VCALFVYLRIYSGQVLGQRPDRTVAFKGKQKRAFPLPDVLQASFLHTICPYLHARDLSSHENKQDVLCQLYHWSL
jgi:hypothetical protein